MKSYRSITVGISPESGSDNVSESSRRAAAQARWLAERTGASISLLHSTWNEDESLAEEGVIASPEFVSSIEALAKQCSQTGVQSSIHYSSDRPWLALTKRAIKSESDLIFVGKHDATQPRGMGINTRNLLRNCPAPVWVVDPHTEPIGHLILAATDLSAVGDRVTEMAAYLAIQSKSELHIVHAWQRGMADQLQRENESDDETKRRVAARESKIAEHVLAGLMEARDQLEPSLHIGCTAPELAISDGVKALKPELVVMGTLSRSGVSGLLVGNTAERIVGDIPCSLLTVKPEGFVSPVSE